MSEVMTITDRALIPADLLTQAGQAANRAAARHVFEDYRERKAQNTIRRQDAELALFARYLLEVAGIEAGDFAHDADAWAGMTWGLVQGFVKWQLDSGYAVGSVNVRLSTVKVYAKLAAKAGTLERSEYAMVRTVEGYRHAEALHVDRSRRVCGLETRKSTKKADPVTLTQEQAEALKTHHPSDGQGRRDRLMMCLFLDHGLRCGELAALTIVDFDLAAGELRFYRQKVDKVQTHRLTPATFQAARAYLQRDAPQTGPIWRSSTRSGRLTGACLSTRAITARVRDLGQRIGIENLSAHDLRHGWATTAARNETPLDRLMDAGGWSSPAMPLRYVEAAVVANEGVRLGKV